MPRKKFVLVFYIRIFYNLQPGGGEVGKEWGIEEDEEIAWRVLSSST